MEFAKRLKELRTEKELSYKQLENIIQIDDSTLCRWEKGQLDAVCINIKKLAEFFDVSTDYLLGLKDY